MAGKFEELDQALTLGIVNGCNTFAALVDTAGILALANTLALPDRYGHRDGGRLVDRRLQALRKAGKITFRGGRWHPSTT